MKNLAFIGVAFLISCSTKNEKVAPAANPQPPTVKNQPEIKKPEIEYVVVTLDTAKKFQIQHFILSPLDFDFRKSTLRKGKKFESSSAGVESDEQLAGESSLTMPELTNFTTVITDKTNGIVITSSYTCHSMTYSVCTNCDIGDQWVITRSNVDGIISKTQLQINYSKEALPFTFTENGVKIPKKFVEKFKKSFAL